MGASGGGEVELVAGSIRTAQSELVELQKAFEVREVREQHLDLFALAARSLVDLGLGHLAARSPAPS